MRLKLYGDGYSYSDNEGRAIANYSTDGENWGTHQNTLTIDADSTLRRYRFEIILFIVGGTQPYRLDVFFYALWE